MRAFEIFGASLASGLMTPADVTSKSPLLARTRSLRCFLSRTLFEDKRPHSNQGWTGKMTHSGLSMDGTPFRTGLKAEADRQCLLRADRWGSTH
jgi:hypothetical protein